MVDQVFGASPFARTRTRHSGVAQVCLEAVKTRVDASRVFANARHRNVEGLQEHIRGDGCCTAKGGTGVMVRTLIACLRSRA